MSTETTPEILPRETHILKTFRPDPGLLVQTFLQGRTPKTLRAYREDLADFAAFVGAKSREEAASHLLSQEQGAAVALVMRYRDHLRAERKLSPATVNRRLAALRSLLKLARMLGLSTLQLEVSNLPAECYRDTRGPGREGFREMLKELSLRRDKKGVRDRAILRLLYDLALRRQEVVSLRLSDLDLSGKTIWVLGKGRQTRQKLTLAPETREALCAWLKVRGDEPGPLFFSLDPASWGGPLSSSGIYRIVRKLGEQVGIRARPHGLRHAAITQALDATGGDVRAVQRFSRHKSLEVLCLYDDARRDLAGEVSRLVAKST